MLAQHAGNATGKISARQGLAQVLRSFSKVLRPQRRTGGLGRNTFAEMVDTINNVYTLYRMCIYIYINYHVYIYYVYIYVYRNYDVVMYTYSVIYVYLHG